MDENSGLRKFVKAVKKDKTILLILLFLVFLLIYSNLYVTAVLTKTIEVTEFVFGLQVIKSIFQSSDKVKAFLCILSLEFAMYLYITMNKPTYKSKLMEITPDIHIPAPAGQGQFGNARFLRKDEIDTTFKSQLLSKRIISDDNLEKYGIESGGLVIGKKDTKKGEIIYYLDDDKHTLNIGGTGSGKTRCIVLQSVGLIALSGESILCTDVKGEISDYTRPFLEKCGYEVKIINYSEPEYSDYWNYLQVIIHHVDKDNIPAAIDATWDLTSQLVGEPKGERLWNDGEASMIAASIMAVVYDNREGERKRFQNLPNVYYFLINMCKPVTVGKNQVLPLSVYVNTLPKNHPSKGLLGVSDIAPSRTRGSFYTSAVMTLKLFTNPYIANMSSKSNFDFADLGRKKMAVFLILPDDRKTYHDLATLTVAQAYTILSKEAETNGGRLQNRVNVLADEFGNFSKLANIEQMMTMSRSKGIRYYLFIQSFAQLEKTYEKVGERIIKDNCDFTIYLKANDPDTRKAISESLDKYTIQSYSTSANSNRSSTAITSTGSSVQLQGRELLTPDEVKQIKRPYSLVITETHPAIMYAPDLSQWQFNDMFGMGDPEHNQKLRMERRANRIKSNISQDIDLWGIWDVIIDEIKRKQKQKQQQMEAERRQSEMFQQLADQMEEIPGQITEMDDD